MKQPATPTGSFQEKWFRHFGVRITEEQALDYEDKITKLVAFVARHEMKRHRERGPPP